MVSGFTILVRLLFEVIGDEALEVLQLTIRHKNICKYGLTGFILLHAQQLDAFAFTLSGEFFKSKFGIRAGCELNLNAEPGAEPNLLLAFCSTLCQRMQVIKLRAETRAMLRPVQLRQDWFGATFCRMRGERLRHGCIR